MAGYASWSEVPPEWQRALSEENLLECAGQAVFARGLAYYAKHKARLQDEDGDHSHWQVHGTETYFVDVAIRNSQLHVSCTCPYGIQDFCKHMVAACLTWRAHLGGDRMGVKLAPAPTARQTASAAANEKRKATMAGKRDALRAFVGGQDAAALASRLWAWAERDSTLMADLKTWAALSQPMSDPQAMKAAITELLLARGFLDSRGSSIYAQKARKVLPLLEQARQADAVQARQLCEHTLRRLYTVCALADDSNGDIGDLLHSVMDLLFDCLEAAPPPDAWLDTWLALVKADPWGLWREDAVLDFAGEAMAQRYAAKVASEWAQWVKAHPPARQAKASRDAGQGFGDLDWERHKLRDRYLVSLKRQGDVQGALDAMRAHLANAGEHSELVAYCESLDKMREALQYAQAAFKLYPEDPRCEADLLRCCERDGWDEEALALRRRQLERMPTVQHYQAVLEAAGRAGRDVAQYRAQLYEWAERHDHKVWTPAAGYVGTRVEWLLADGNIDEALALVQPPGRCAPAQLRRIARGLPKARHAEAVPLMLRVFDAAMPGASSPYHEVLSVVAETAGYMSAPERQQWLQALRLKYKARRNFIQGLEALAAKA